MKKNISHDTQVYNANCDEISLSLVSLSFQPDINFIEKYDGKNQWRTICEVIYYLYFEKGKMFAK